MIKLAYIAGPYSSSTRIGIALNIYRARAVAVKLIRNFDKWQMFPACPHLNTAWMQHDAPASVFYLGDLELLARCDCIVLTTLNFQGSKGTVAEIRQAAKAGQPIYYISDDGQRLVEYQWSE